MRILDANDLIRCPQTGTQLRRYELLVEELAQGSFLCESYGLAIAELPTGERAELRHITLSQPVILDLLTLLVQNGASASALRDIVEDYLIK